MGVYQKNLFLPSYIYSRSRFQSPQRNLRNLPRHYFYILFHASTNRYILGKKKCQEKFTLLWCCCYQKKNSRENRRDFREIHTWTGPPWRQSIFGVSLAYVSFRWGLRGVPGATFRNAIYRPFIYFRPFLSEPKGREADTRVSIAILISYCDRSNALPDSVWMVYTRARHSPARQHPFVHGTLTPVYDDVVSMWNHTLRPFYETSRATISASLVRQSASACGWSPSRGEKTVLELRLNATAHSCHAVLTWKYK